MEMCMEKNEIVGYEPLVNDLKQLIQKKQYHVLRMINSETINLYWEIGEEIYRQSIMNQLNEIVCKFEAKDRTLIAYFLSAILNHVGKNKDKVRVFKKDVSESTVFSFLDLVYYAYSFFPNYNNTQKLLSIISYVRDEYDIFSKSRSLQNLINKYGMLVKRPMVITDDKVMVGFKENEWEVLL